MADNASQSRLQVPQWLAAPSERELRAWLCGSFGAAAILLGAATLTLDGFNARDKYVLVALLLGGAPFLALALGRPLAAPGRLEQARLVLVVNLAAIAAGALWLSALDAPKWRMSSARTLALVYVALLTAALVAARRRARLPARLLLGAHALLAAATPATLVAACVLSADWLLPAAFDHAAGAGAGLAAIGLVATWRAGWPHPAHARRERALRLAAGIVVFCAPFAMMDPLLSYDTLHYTAYLAPATAVLAGGWPLLDVFCQYGLSYLAYAATFLVLPRTYHTAALATTVLNAAYLLCCLVILRRLVRNHLAFLVLGATLPLFFWMTYHFSPNMVPSHGGMRYLPVATLAVALVYLPGGRAFSAGSVTAVVVAWLWSFEAAVYASLLYAAVLLSCAWSASGSVATRAGTFLRPAARLLGLALLVAAAVLAFYLALRGQLPRYDLYLSLVLSYIGPDPFMEYAYFQPGFFGWVPVLLAYFVAVCLLADRASAGDGAQWKPALAAVTALGISVGVYCVLSTQAFILKVGLMPFYLLLYWALATAIERPRGGLSMSALGLAPVLALLAYLVGGVAYGTFSKPPVYASPNSTLARHLAAHGRLLPADFAERLGRYCSPAGVVEQGNVCEEKPSNMPATHFTEFARLLDKWQGTSPALLTFHPVDVVMNVYLQKPNRMPVSFSYVDGFSPALFADILSRARRTIAQDIREDETVVMTKDLAGLNELQWALLKELCAVWSLVHVDESQNFAVYRLVRGSRKPAGAFRLPERPVRTRNAF